MQHCHHSIKDRNETTLPNQDCSDNSKEKLFLSEGLTRLSRKTTMKNYNYSYTQRQATIEKEMKISNGGFIYRI